MTTTPPGPEIAAAPRRRRLRAVFAADVANYGGLVAIDETKTLDSLSLVRRIATETLAQHGGWLFGLPGDGVFALFESAIDAVRCGLDMQSRLTNVAQLDDLKLRIGIHLGEVVFENELPFGEALVIAARLESLAEPGGILVSAAVRDAVALRINARFEDLGVRPLKHSPRQINTFGVSPALKPAEAVPVQAPAAAAEPAPAPAPAPAPLAGGRPEIPDQAPRHDASVVAPAVAPDEAVTAQPRTVPTAGPEPEIVPARRPRDPKDRSILPSLPPAQALIVPTILADTSGRSRGMDRTRAGLDRAKPSASPAPSAPPAAVQACLGELTAALTIHLGPIARVLAPRAAAGARSPLELAERLGSEVKNEAERRHFLAAASRIIERLAR